MIQDYNLWLENQISSLKCVSNKKIDDLKKDGVDLVEITQQLDNVRLDNLFNLKEAIATTLILLLYRKYNLGCDKYRLREVRELIKTIVRASPSLNGYLIDWIEMCYGIAKVNLLTVAPNLILPNKCPFTYQEIYE